MDEAALPERVRVWPLASVVVMMASDARREEATAIAEVPVRVAVVNATVSPLMTVERTMVVAAGRSGVSARHFERGEACSRSMGTTWLSAMMLVDEAPVPGVDPPFALEELAAPCDVVACDVAAGAVAAEFVGEGLFGVAGAEVAGGDGESWEGGLLEGTTTTGVVVAAAGRVVMGAEGVREGRLVEGGVARDVEGVVGEGLATGAAEIEVAIPREVVAVGGVEEAGGGVAMPREVEERVRGIDEVVGGEVEVEVGGRTAEEEEGGRIGGVERDVGAEVGDALVATAGVDVGATTTGVDAGEATGQFPICNRG